MEPHEKNQDVTIAVIKNDVDYIKKEVNGIVGKLEVLERSYIRRDEVEDGMGGMLASIKTLELNLEIFKTQVKTWGTAALLLLGMLQFAISQLPSLLK